VFKFSPDKNPESNREIFTQGIIPVIEAYRFIYNGPRRSYTSGDGLKITNLALFALTLLSLEISAKVIYGKDHRLEVFQSKEFHQKLAQAAVSMIPRRSIQLNSDGQMDFEQSTLGEWLEDAFNEDEDDSQMSKESRITYCAEERFVGQPSPSLCSGFLIAPDLILTAGHCVVKKDFCKNNAWVFDFKIDPSKSSIGIDVNPDTIYSCKRLIINALNMKLGLDYALVQLDRPARDREPLEIRSEGIVEDSAELVVIGSPSGLPLKVADGAKVRSNSHPFYFMTNTDTFQGNSGSAIINDKTGVVEGILVRGEDDFVKDPIRNCVQANVCQEDECMGEGVSRLTSIPEVAYRNILFKAAETGDVETLKKIIAVKIWIDFNGKDGQTALMKAAANSQVDAMKVLIKAGADLNHEDSKGLSVIDHLKQSLKITAVEALNLLLFLMNS